jgi:hypothetical protein
MGNINAADLSCTLPGGFAAPIYDCVARVAALWWLLLLLPAEGQLSCCKKLRGAWQQCITSHQRA